MRISKTGSDLLEKPGAGKHLISENIENCFLFFRINCKIYLFRLIFKIKYAARQLRIQSRDK